MLAALNFLTLLRPHKDQIELLEGELAADTPTELAGFANENVSAYASFVIGRPCCTKKTDSRVVFELA